MSSTYNEYAAIGTLKKSPSDFDNKGVHSKATLRCTAGMPNHDTNPVTVLYLVEVTETSGPISEHDFLSQSFEIKMDFDTSENFGKRGNAIRDYINDKYLHQLGFCLKAIDTDQSKLPPIPA